MVHKLRKAMEQWDNRYTLEWKIAADEGYFTIEASARKHKIQKAGRDSKTKNNVMILAESAIWVDIDTEKVERQPRYFKVKVLTDHKI